MQLTARQASAALLTIGALAVAASPAAGATQPSGTTLPMPAATHHGSSVTLTRSATFTYRGPRLVSVRGIYDYVLTPATAQWGRAALVVAFVVCTDTASGRKFRSPYATENWVWPQGAPPTAPFGQSVVLKLHWLLADDALTAGSRVRCSLRSYLGTGAQPTADNQPILRGRGARQPRGRQASYLRIGPATAGAINWNDRDDTYLAADKAAFVLRKGFRSGAGALRVTTGVQLTTCYEGTASCRCPAADSKAGCDPATIQGADTIGSTVEARLFVSQLDAAGNPCAGGGNPVATTVVTIPNKVHHRRLEVEGRVQRNAAAGCIERYAVKLLLTRTAGNPVRVHGRGYSNGIALPQ